MRNSTAAAAAAAAAAGLINGEEDKWMEWCGAERTGWLR